MEWLAILKIKKKANLEKTKPDKSSITSKPAKSKPQGGKSHEASGDTTDNSAKNGLSQHREDAVSDKESDEEVVMPPPGSTPAPETTSTRSKGGSSDEDEDKEVLIESDQDQLGRFSCSVEYRFKPNLNNHQNTCRRSGTHQYMPSSNRGPLLAT